VTAHVYYNLDGGTNHGSNPASYKAANLPILLQTPTKDGYIFEAWYAEPAYTNSVSQIILGTTGDVNLYAKWRQPIEPDQENQPGGLVEIPALPAARAYWLAPSGMGNVGDTGAFVAGATMTTADEEGLTSIATPVNDGTYYLYYVVKDTKEILSISPNYLTVIADNIPYYYKGRVYLGVRDSFDETWYKMTAKATNFLADWVNVGAAMFSSTLHKADSWCRNDNPLVAVNKLNGDVWMLSHKSNTNVGNQMCDIELWQHTASANSWNLRQTITYPGYAHSVFTTMAMTNDASTMFISRTGWRSAGDWPEIFEKRSGSNFVTSELITGGTRPSVLKIGGNYLFMISQTNDLTASNETMHTAKLESHTGMTIKRYDISTAFQTSNFVTLGSEKFNLAGSTKYRAFQPELYISGSTPYVVFVEPTVYEHCRHNTGSPSWQYTGWNDYLENPKLTVMKYNGSEWVLVGANLFSPVVYKTTATSYAIDTTVRTGYNAPGETDRTTTDSVRKPGLCVGGGNVFVTATDVDDKAFICKYDGTSWTVIKSNYGTGVREPKMIYDNGKLYIVYSKDDASVGYYVHTP
jgi:uncharacterized repeat protein (TIGR02543 family)